MRGFITLAHSENEQEPGGSLVHQISLRNIEYLKKLEGRHSVAGLIRDYKKVDYLQMAYLQCLSQKINNPEYPFAIITDENSFDRQPKKIQDTFDKVIFLEKNRTIDKKRIDWQLYDLTPFDETIKAESDLIYTTNMKDWWNVLTQYDVAFSMGARDYMGNLSKVRKYRKEFDDAFVPDVYTGLMFWKKTERAKNYFDLTRKIYQNWDSIQKKLNTKDPCSNDFVFGLAAKMFPDAVNHIDFFNLVHMKPAINHIQEYEKWFEKFSCVINPPDIAINNIKQKYPIHYFEKDWVTDELIEKYETSLSLKKVSIFT